VHPGYEAGGSFCKVIVFRTIQTRDDKQSNCFLCIFVFSFSLLPYTILLNSFFFLPFFFFFFTHHFTSSLLFVFIIIITFSCTPPSVHLSNTHAAHALIIIVSLLSYSPGEIKQLHNVKRPLQLSLSLC
jgi:hypothetical protein